jgi:hypothetical protein
MSGSRWRVSGVGTQNGVGLFQARKVGGGMELARGHEARDDIIANVPDIRFTAVEPRDFSRIDVASDDRKALAGEGPRQRQADVTQADDGHGRGTVLDALLEPGGGHAKASKEH